MGAYLRKLGHDYLVNLLVGTTLVAFGALGAILTANYHATLGALKKAHVHLDPFQAALVGLPTAALIAIVLVLVMAFGLLVWLLAKRQNSLNEDPAELRVATGSDLLATLAATQEALKEELGKNLDLTNRLADSNKLVADLKAKVTYPKFDAQIHQILFSDPTEEPDLYSVWIVTVANHGAPSVARVYKAAAKTVQGISIKVDIVYFDRYRLLLNDGKDCIDYTDDDFVTTRTYSKPVLKGVPVTGVLICLFRGITDWEKIDVRTVKFSFTDAIGDEQGKNVWWESEPFGEVDSHKIVKPGKWIGLPVIKPVQVT